MSCLKQILCGERTIIGIRDYEGCSKPESDLFINDLPGISLKIAANIANEEVFTGVEVMKKCINTAIKKVFNDFNLKISPYFNFNAIIQTREIDDFSDAVVIPQSGTERGLILKRWRSELAQIYIENIYVKVDTDSTVNIKIFDGDTQVLTIQENLTANKINQIFVDRKFNSETVKVVMENTGFGVYSNDINNNWGYGGCGTCGGSNSEGLVVKGWDGSEEDNTLYGIGVKASVRCYEENLLCSLLPRMYFFVWYQSGVEFMKEKIYTDRLNPIATYTKDRAKELLDEYQTEYAVQYNIFTKNIFAYIRSLKGECLTCNGNRYAQIHP